MKILHTSDWHLGHQLYQQKREEEHRAFLEWLLQVIGGEQVELLLVAGDIFDSGLPSNYALEMYYSFLARAASQGCRHIVVVGGNHDSPSTLQAPQAVLRALDVTVVGAIDPARPEAGLVVVRDAADAPQAIVCAVPYLRDRDVYFPKFGESNETRTQGIVDGTADWYHRQTERAVALRQQLGRPQIPIIATGHLFAQGMTKAGTERDLYVGDLGMFPVGRFPPELAYVALGHLHRPQAAKGHDHVRYSGAPVPCSFDEATHDKKVFVLDSTSPADVAAITVPVFRRLIRARGNLSVLAEELGGIPPAPLKPWVEVVFEGDAPISDLQERVLAMAAKGAGQVLTCRDLAAAGPDSRPLPPIDELSPLEVFELCLEESGTRAEDREMVREAFGELLRQVRQGESA